MPPHGKRRAPTECRRRMAKRQVSPSSSFASRRCAREESSSCETTRYAAVPPPPSSSSARIPAAGLHGAIDFIMAHARDCRDESSDDPPVVVVAVIIIVVLPPSPSCSRWRVAPLSPPPPPLCPPPTLPPHTPQSRSSAQMLICHIFITPHSESPSYRHAPHLVVSGASLVTLFSILRTADLLQIRV